MLRLVRWPNALIAAAGVLLGAWWAGGDPFRAPSLLAALCAVALTCVANAENDRRDVEIDRVAHPTRPLPAGELSVRAAAAVAAAGGLAAIALAITVGGAVALATPLVLAAMLLYTPYLKPAGLPGNAAVAVLGSLPFLYGGWSVGNGRAALALVALAIPLHLARELAKDLDDAHADAANRRTLPVTAGPRAARAALLLSFLLFVGVLAWLAAERPRVGAVLLPAVVIAGAGTWRALGGRPGAPALLKAAMVCAMAALPAAR